MDADENARRAALFTLHEKQDMCTRKSAGLSKITTHTSNNNKEEKVCIYQKTTTIVDRQNGAIQIDLTVKHELKIDAVRRPAAAAATATATAVLLRHTQRREHAYAVAAPLVLTTWWRWWRGKDHSALCSL